MIKKLFIIILLCSVYVYGQENTTNQQFMNSDDFVGIWHFNEGSGTTLYDSASKSTGGVVEATWVHNQDMFASYLEYDGSNDVAYIYNPLAGATKFTIFLKITKQATGEQNAHILGHYTGDLVFWFWDDDNLYIAIYDKDNDYGRWNVSGSIPTYTPTWYAVRWNGGNTVNDVDVWENLEKKSISLDSNSGTMNELDNKTTALLVGARRWWDPGFTWAGQIDEIAISVKALSDAKIKHFLRRQTQ